MAKKDADSTKREASYTVWPWFLKTKSWFQRALLAGKYA